MPYHHGILTENLRDYLGNYRKNATPKDRAVYDFHLREILKCSLDDVVFILRNVDKKQFDKTSKEIYEQITVLFCSYCKRYIDRSDLKYPWGRIKKHRVRTGFRFTLPIIDTVTDLAQNSLDSLFGKDVFYVHVLSSEAHRDYEKWFAETKKGKVAWKEE